MPGDQGAAAMRLSIVHWVSAVAIGIAVAVSSSSAADAQSIMKICGDQWKQAKANGATDGQTWPQFLAQCRTQQPSNGAAAPATAPTPATGATSTQTTGGKSAKDCNAEYAANKDAIKSGGQTKRDFVAACRSGTETIPNGAAAAPVAPAPAPAPTPTAAAPAPVQQAAPAPVPMAPRTNARATGAGGFSTDAQARSRCPSDTVVWVNTRSGIYHFPGTHNYGTTKEGAYMCEADARAANDRAAANEKHP
jgi:hypothetical protein